MIRAACAALLVLVASSGVRAADALDALSEARLLY